MLLEQETPRYPVNTRGGKRKEKRKGREVVQEARNSLTLIPIQPKSSNQSRVMRDFFTNEQHLVMHGMAGTGKTFLSLYCALYEVLNKTGLQEKVHIIRSAVPSRDMGFLPGSAKDKMKEYESPYYEICGELFGRGDAYDLLKQKKLVEFTSSSFLRGKTFKNCFVVVDEIQNMSDQELNTIMTRIGRDARVIFCGDLRQNDMVKTRSGLRDFLRILREIPDFSLIEFGIDDIVRSGVVRQYLIARQKLEDSGTIQPIER
jgi:predicted ribonuclease YlaK